MGIHLVTLARSFGFRGSKQATLIALAERANEKRLKNRNQCWPGLTTLARDAGYCVRTVQARLNELEREGHITRIYRTGASTIYWVHPGGKRTPAKAAGAQYLHPNPASGASSPRNRCGETKRNHKKNRSVSAIGEIVPKISVRALTNAELDEESDQIDQETFSKFVAEFGKQVQKNR